MIGFKGAVTSLLRLTLLPLLSLLLSLSLLWPLSSSVQALSAGCEILSALGGSSWCAQGYPVTEEMRQRYAGQPQKISTLQQENWNDGNAIVVRLTVPLKADSNWRQHLTVRMDDTQLSADNWVLESNGLMLVYPFIEPDREFTVAVEPGLQGINNNTLVQPAEVSFHSRSTEPGVSFNGDGYVLSDALRRALPVSTLNVDDVDLEIFRIRPELIGEWVHYTHTRRASDYMLNHFASQADMIYSGRFVIKHQPHQRTITNLDLSAIKALDQPGAYVAVLSAPGVYNSEFATSFFTISDIGIRLRRNDRLMRVNANSIISGEVLEGVTLSIYDGKKRIAQQQTNALGEAEFPALYSEGDTLIAQQGNQYTVIDFNGRPLDLSAFANPVSLHQPLQIFAWGARNLYRPGERVDVFALLRDFDGKAAAAMPLDVSLYDATGSRVTTRTLNPDDSSRYVFSYPLSANAATGNWRLEYASAGSDQLYHRYEFSVEAFIPERLSLSLFPGDEQQYRQTARRDEVTIPLLSRYLYGAPAAGNRYDALVVAELDKHPFQQWPGYFFGNDQESVQPSQQHIYGAELNEQGEGELIIPVQPWSGVRSPLSLITSVSVYESGGRPITRRTVVTNILSDKLVGLEPQFEQSADDNSQAEFKAILTDPHGQLLAGKQYRYRLLREDRNYYWRYNEASGWNWEYDPLNYEVFSGHLAFDGKTPTAFSVPLEWGRYRLEVQDAQGNIITSHRFATHWSGWGNNNGDGLKPDQVMMQWQQDSYQPGETAHLTITPAVDGMGFLTLESNDGVLWRQQLAVSAAGTQVDIPLDASWQRHDVYATVTVLTPGDMQHSVAPKRAFGLLHLPLRRPDAALKIAIEAPEKVESNRTVTVGLNMSADVMPEGDVWVSLAAVDVGVLNIKRFQTPDPLAYWFSPKRYDYQLYDVYGNIIENAGFDYASQRFGGGRFMKSAAELVRGGEPPDNDVQIVALPSQRVRFDPQGKASIEVNIPDFNGTLRWMAVAWSDQAYGSQESETKVVDAVVTQLSRPRFLALNDHAEVTLDVSNQSGIEQHLTVNFSVGGALQSQSWQQHMVLAQQQRQVLNFPVDAKALGEGTLQVSITNAEQTLAQEKSWKLAVRSAFPAVTRKRLAVINAASPWTLPELTGELIPASVQARLMLSTQPPINITSHFDALLRYPYGCTEQTTSSGYPWVLLTPELAERFDLNAALAAHLEAEFDPNLRRQQIEAAIERLLKRQNSRGGFSAWGNAAQGDEMSWLSVYVSDFLMAAQEAGVQVPYAALQAATTRLEDYLAGNVTLRHSYGESPEYYRFATQAYAAYVLARSNRASLAQLRRLYQRYQQTESRSGLPWAHLGYALQQAGDHELAAEAFARASATPYRDGYYGDYGSELRDAALLYAVLAKAGVAQGEQLLTVFDLARQRTWLSTQERNALFQVAVASALDQTNPAVNNTANTTKGVIKTADFSQTIATQGAFATLLDYAQLQSIKTITASDNTLYAALEVMGEQQTPPSSYHKEMFIRRDYFDLNGKPQTLNTLNAGDLLLVRLTVSAERRMPDALVVDLLPAGLELENQNLAEASVDLSKLLVDGQRVLEWQQANQVEHIEYLDDRFVAALTLDDNRSRELFYLVRAVTPGRYQVPPAYAEDMYRPYYHALGRSFGVLTIKP